MVVFHRSVCFRLETKLLSNSLSLYKNYCLSGRVYPYYHITDFKEVCLVAKKVIKVVKLQIPAGKANPAPPVGPALGQAGVNIMGFCKDFNAKSAKLGDTVVPVIITVYADRSYSFVMKSAPA